MAVISVLPTVSPFVPNHCNFGARYARLASQRQDGLERVYNTGVSIIGSCLDTIASVRGVERVARAERYGGEDIQDFGGDSEGSQGSQVDTFYTLTLQADVNKLLPTSFTSAATRAHQPEAD
ncbi:unnamed protein product [Ceratitis capitata]|uniref:(Mediterranean fruit fly) hypothetical protein n=1 Tax=Ceratitis capitata TaxID=7213 RepID=A0A811UWZ3_CERCA|nr:unnamed protein product [Ceratitis capitata]